MQNAGRRATSYTTTQHVRRCNTWKKVRGREAMSYNKAQHITRQYKLQYNEIRTKCTRKAYFLDLPLHQSSLDELIPQSINQSGSQSRDLLLVDQNKIKTALLPGISFTIAPSPGKHQKLTAFRFHPSIQPTYPLPKMLSRRGRLRREVQISWGSSFESHRAPVLPPSAYRDE